MSEDTKKIARFMCESAHLVSSSRIFLKTYLNLVYFLKLHVPGILPGNAKPSLPCAGYAEMHLKNVCETVSYIKNK